MNVDATPYAGAIYLSPHLDDAVLSCGAAIAERTAAGHRVTVLTLCSGEPERIGPFAERLHAFWGLSAADAMTERRLEDRLALARLGADWIHLGFVDAIYRQPELYDCDEWLYGEILDDNAHLDEVCGRLREVHAQHPTMLWYAPLGIGRHVDHQLAHLAGRRLRQHGATVGFYEDVPYVFTAGALESRLRDVSCSGPFVPSQAPISARAMRMWLTAIGDYTSQFADHDALGCAVRAHAVSRAEGEYTQRIWWPADQCSDTACT